MYNSPELMNSILGWATCINAEWHQDNTSVKETKVIADFAG